MTLASDGALHFCLARGSFFSISLPRDIAEGIMDAVFLTSLGVTMTALMHSMESMWQANLSANQEQERDLNIYLYN